MIRTDYQDKPDISCSVQYKYSKADQLMIVTIQMTQATELLYKDQIP